MISITNNLACCGCTACASSCPHGAIRMEPDALGFQYPRVDISKCVDCGLCDSICQFNDKYDISLNLSQPIAYAARHKDINQIMKSRSGAAFVAISDYIIENGGVVYGVGYNDHFRVAHKRASTKDERDEFRGSKYVQSDLTGVFSRVIEDLNNGFLVLFSGTPCQTSGLKSIVNKQQRSKLYLVDIVCHGVPSPYIWRDYISFLEKKRGSTIREVNFRDKEVYGWKKHKETFKFSKDEKKVNFPYFFYQHIYFRQSCSVCHYTNLKRPSDITLADYWGWERTDPEFNKDNRGCSLVLCNTEKGLSVFEKVKGRMNTIPAELDNITQTHLMKPLEMHPHRMKFEQLYIKGGFEYAVKKMGMMGWRYSFNNVIRKARRMISIMKRRLIPEII